MADEHKHEEPPRPTHVATDGSSTVYSPTFKCYVTMHFYSALLLELQNVATILDRCSAPARRDVWRQLYMLVGVAPDSARPHPFCPIIRGWVRTDSVNLLAVELLYLAIAIAGQRNPLFISAALPPQPQAELAPTQVALQLERAFPMVAQQMFMAEQQQQPQHAYPQPPHYAQGGTRTYASSVSSASSSSSSSPSTYGNYGPQQQHNTAYTYGSGGGYGMHNNAPYMPGPYSLYRQQPHVQNMSYYGSSQGYGYYGGVSQNEQNHLADGAASSHTTSGADAAAYGGGGGAGGGSGSGSGGGDGSSGGESHPDDLTTRRLDWLMFWSSGLDRLPADKQELIRGRNSKPEIPQSHIPAPFRTTIIAWAQDPVAYASSISQLFRTIEVMRDTGTLLFDGDHHLLPK